MQSPSRKRNGLAAMSLAALGVVYGDIGTSPLYTIKEVFAESTGVTLNPPHLIGVVSVITRDVAQRRQHRRFLPNSRERGD